MVPPNLVKLSVDSVLGLAVLVSVWLVTPARAGTSTASFGGGAFTMDFVDIGNPGNTADTTGAPNPAGAVVNSFWMGKFEVSRDIILKANTAGTLGITLADMSGHGGNGVDRPATGVSWNEAARFVNWLNTSSGSVPAYKFSLQPGAPGYSADTNIELWLPGDDGYDSANRYRNSNAKFFLPSENEWYKAAYFDGSTGIYGNYPTGGDTAPSAVASGTTAGTAVFGQIFTAGPADSTTAGGLSPYGTMGQGGNVWEWTETSFNLLVANPDSFRAVRGGSWGDGVSYLGSSSRDEVGNPTGGSILTGFRVASSDFVAVPEPRSILMGLALLTGGLLRRNRGKK